MTEYQVLFDNFNNPIYGYVINGVSTMEPDNVTASAVRSSTHPTGYSIVHLVTSSVVVSAIMLVIIVGNVLVVLAVSRDRSLSSPQNWFIASLALSDILVGLFIMPLSLANELMGYWVFGSVLCELWLSTDVLLCTASILNLVLISLDRYWSITRAVEYSRFRTRSRAAGMIAVVWTLSAVICFPPLVGWKRPQPVREDGLDQCLLSREPGYIVYSTVGSFYIPLVVMIAVYLKIYHVTKTRARRCLKKTTKPPAGRNSNNRLQLTVNENNLLHVSKNSLAEDTTRDDILSRAEEEEDEKTPGSSDTLLQANNTLLAKRHPKLAATAATSDDIEDEDDEDDCSPASMRSAHQQRTTRFLARSNLAIIGQTIIGRSSGSSAPTSGGDNVAPSVNGVTTVADLVQARLNDPDHRRKRIARAKERRAFLVLGVVMASFIGCWLPFFSVYLVTSLAGPSLPAPPSLLFAVFFWLGYCNSALNPIIYTIFNRDFRRAFKKSICGMSVIPRF